MVCSLLLSIPLMRTIIEMIARFYFGNFMVRLNRAAIRMLFVVLDTDGIVVRQLNVIFVLLSFGMSLSLEFVE